MNPDAPSWNNYRWRRRWFFILWLIGVLVLKREAASIIGSAIPIVLGAWLVAFILAANYLSTFPCPRCGLAFFRKSFWHNPLARRCMHCDLPKWSEGDLDA